MLECSHLDRNVKPLYSWDTNDLYIEECNYCGKILQVLNKEKSEIRKVELLREKAKRLNKEADEKIKQIKKLKEKKS